MKTQQFNFQYQLFDSVEELDAADALLLAAARKATANAYAPYSHFHVGAAARLANGEMMSGSNQENASYPVGICAERVLLSSCAAVYPGVVIEAMAVTYDSQQVVSDHPVAPCGLCRQTLQEYESRFDRPIRMIMAGMKGEIIIIPTTQFLLPFGFSSKELG